MSKSILIKIAELTFKAELNDSKTAEKIYAKLPIDGSVNLWGDEIYFAIPVESDLEPEFCRDVVDVGDLGYWPQGACFCIFFGPTPNSIPGEIRPASSVNVIGRLVEESRERLKNVAADIKIVLDRA